MINNIVIPSLIILGVIGVIIVILYFTAKNAKESQLNNSLSILNMYQYSELIIGTTIFFILYIFYQLFTTGNSNMFDLLYNTCAFCAILTLGNIVTNWVEYNQN